MKRIGIYLAHPAHFHLFKNVIALLEKGNDVFVLYNDKDVLHELIESSSFAEKSFKIKTNKNINSKIDLYIQFIQKNWGALRLFYRLKPDIVAGTPILISLLGKVLPYKSIIVNEDDFDVIKKTADFGYPHADRILCPEVCRTTKFNSKVTKYNSYHELAYLHPRFFTPNFAIASKYINGKDPYFIMRFAKLSAHHDDGIAGLSNRIAHNLINILEPYGNVFITSERELDKSLEPYRISIHAEDMHHVMAFAQIYIGDSQTMAAESGVLGVPFVRFNDFVGKISYLEELEEKYELGFGIVTNAEKELYRITEELVTMKGRKEIFMKRRTKMLDEKIEFASYLAHFIESFPESLKSH